MKTINKNTDYINTGYALTPLEVFELRLPKKPYQTDNLSYGIKPLIASLAKQSRYIQPNGATHKYWLVFDLDYEAATIAWDLRDAPAPNVIVTNKQNGHAHYLYCLETPIRTAPDGSSKALKYAAAVEQGLIVKLDSDRAYSGLICKNPLHESWIVSIWEQHAYTLDWLADYLDLSTVKKIDRDVGLGRNFFLFETLRKWAYKAIRQGFDSNFNQWLNACETRAQGINTQFIEPLPHNEVKHTAKSVAKFTYRNFSAAGFSQWQAEKGSIGGKAGSKEDKARAGSMSKGGGRPKGYDSGLLDSIIKLKATGLSNRGIAEDLNISASTVSKYLKI